MFLNDKDCRELIAGAIPDELTQGRVEGGNSRFTGQGLAFEGKGNLGIYEGKIHDEICGSCQVCVIYKTVRSGSVSIAPRKDQPCR